MARPWPTMRKINRLLLSSGRLFLLASLVAPLGCYSPMTGGSPGSGGSTGSGGDGSGSGGTTGSGGTSDTGGTTGTGGTADTGSGGSGGTTASGGTTGSGGSSGGTTGSGGKGGTTGSGGTTSSGGTTGSGGSGGATGTGGTTGKGGTTGSGGAGGRGSGGATGAAGRTGNLRIMPLGDSTTSSICYRSHLWQLLTNAGHTQFDFIGTRNGDPGCSFTGYDKDNEGHGGYIVTDILKSTSTGRPAGADPTDLFDASAKDLATWFDGHPADVVLMHFGTNDVWNSKTPTNILQAFSAILTRLRTVNPNVHMLVAQITPLNPSGCSGCLAGVQALNAAIPGWATQNTTTQSPVTVVDQATNFNVSTDTVDGVHATDAGALKIATNWYDALVPLF